MRKFDVVIIGSGPAGFSAAIKALDYNKHVCIIEAGEIGGAGIMNGALVSKTMWELSSYCDGTGHTAPERSQRSAPALDQRQGRKLRPS